jgi:hypothetical protein
VELALGVAVTNYDDGSGKTTLDVARILEAKYSVMGTFYYTREKKIAEWLAQSARDAIRELSHGRVKEKIFAGAEQKIEESFRDFLDASEMATIFSGLTASEAAYFIASTGGFTGAAEARARHRFLHPYASTNKPRPAFIDTGLYQSSFRAWIET